MQGTQFQSLGHEDSVLYKYKCFDCLPALLSYKLQKICILACKICYFNTEYIVK